MKKALCILFSVLMLVSLCGCGAKAKKEKSVLNAPDDIFTYTPVDFSKTIITIGKYDDTNLTLLENAIEARFPDVDIVSAECAGGQDMVQCIMENGAAGKLEDFVLTWDTVPECDYLYDLSGESFSGRYNLSALEAASVNGKLYQLPLSSTLSAIFYNKTLFEEHGWQVPATRDEFYALCDKIEAAGIRAFVPCFKYVTTLQRVGLGLSRPDVITNADKALQLEDYATRTASCKGLLEPLFAAISDLAQRGLVTLDDFGTSATKNRQALYAGEIAMIPYNHSFASYYEQEQPDCEIGMFGYPTDIPNERYMDMSASTSIAVSAQAMQDKDKKQIILDILDYISSNEGQEVLFQCISGISNVTSYQTEIHTDFEDMRECIAAGRCYSAPDLWDDTAIAYFKQVVEGSLTAQQMAEVCDTLPVANADSYPYAAAFATASDAFTMLETSCYYADVMRAQTNADIALMFHRSYTLGNMDVIHKGEISAPHRFYIKGLSADNYLTTYNISGKNLKALLEHPMINGEEVTALYAVSGLKVEYAPWAAADANVVSAALADGTAIDDNKTYTVAAWATTIGEQYIGGVAQEFPDVGNPVEMMTNYITAAGTIAPAKDGRITLNWQTK